MAMTLAVVFFTCIDTSAKWLILAGLPALQVVFTRYAGHLFYALIFYLPQEGAAALRSHSPGRQFLRSLFLMGSTILNGAVIGDNCLIGANTLITEGKEIPAGSLVMGTPGKVVRPLDDAAIETMHESARRYHENGRRFAAGLSKQSP